METTQINKIDDTTIEVTITPEPVPQKQTFTKDFLLEQIAAVQAQKDEFDAAREAELDQLRSYLAEGEKLGLKTQAEAAEAVQVEEEIIP